MTMHNKILPVALVAALLGGSVGALVMRKGSEQPETRVAAANLTTDAQTRNGSQADALRFNDALATEASDKNNGPAVQNAAATDESCYRDGFTDGFQAARNERNNAATSAAAPSRVVYRNAPARRTVRSSRAARTAYYDYQQPRKRSFWQKHRDKLTVAMGAGGGALVGGLVGGKKGAAIGALGGGGGAALYTYKIRNRNRRY
ncbi:MAG: hypothetical protein LC800_20510 [Acidobacteria bacterium]|nr:hypothetical protein [Acidobacteriota bacterium]